MKRTVRMLSKSQRKRLGARIREGRTAAGMNQKELAAHFGTDSGSVSRIESGEREPSLYQFVAATKLFRMPPADLLSL